MNIYVVAVSSSSEYKEGRVEGLGVSEIDLCTRVIRKVLCIGLHRVKLLIKILCTAIRIRLYI